VLKQMKLIYAQGFSKTEKLEWKPVVFSNVVQSMRLIFDVMSDQSIEFENKDNEVRSACAVGIHMSRLIQCVLFSHAEADGGKHG
jgi:hypothetical protein